MNKVLQVAVREFVATAATKGFIIGAFVIPVLVAMLMVFVFPMLLKHEAPAVEGSLAVVDRSGRILEEVRERLAPEAIAARNRRTVAKVKEKVEESVGKVSRGVEQRLEQELSVPRIEVLDAGPGADLEHEKDALRAEPAPGESPRLALAVVAANAVEPDAAGEYGVFELFVRGGLDDRVTDELRESLQGAIRQERLVAADMDPERMRALTTVRAPRTVEVTESGERKSLGAVRIFVSFGFMAVLMMSVLFGGQYLLTSTVEEKSSRVVEVLLSALSPMQLMAGKIIGQLGVGLTILVVYGSVGGGALILFGLADLLGIVTLAYLIVFFLIAYCTVGALQAAIGSAVNDIREAQALQAPVMITTILPYMLWFPISRDPNSTFATVISFLPPVSPFVMVLRITSTEPPPTWQVLLSILVGLAGVYAAMWAAAKVFRIGLLMFGKPPSLATLVRWVRMA